VDHGKARLAPGRPLRSFRSELLLVGASAAVPHVTGGRREGDGASGSRQSRRELTLTISKLVDDFAVSRFMSEGTRQVERSEQR